MSQTQSPDLLSEDEIKDFLRKSFELELDKDALVKPTSNIIIDIYARFLDELYFQEWRNSKYTTDEYQESNVIALMVRWINFTIAPYDISTTFQLKDLLKPIRKRTNYFLNVLIFVKASFDELDKPSWQNWRDEWSEMQDENDRANAQLNSRRLELEELAIRKSRLKPIDELIEIRDSKRKIFDNLQRGAAELHEISKALKSDCKHLEKSVADKQSRGDQLDEECHRLEEKLALLNGNYEIEERITKMKKSNQSQTNELRELEENLKKTQRKVNALQKLLSYGESDVKNLTVRDDLTNNLCSKWKCEEFSREAKLDQVSSYRKKQEHRETEIQYKLERAEKDKGKKKLSSKTAYERTLMDQEAKITILKELAQPSAKSKEIEDEKEAIRRERINFLKKQSAIEGEHQARVDKASTQLETLLKICQESQKKCEPSIDAIQAYNARIEALLGKPKEVELPANRTYIKELGSQKV